MNQYDKEYIETQEKTVSELKKIYNDAVNSVLIGIPFYYLSPEEQFLFEKFPEIEDRFKNIAKLLDKQILEFINERTSKVWDLSNLKNKGLIDYEFGKRGYIAPINLKDPNRIEYERFKNRKVKKLTLSGRVWNINNNLFKKEIEQAVTAAIETGKSAADTSRDVRKYLNNPDALFRRIRDKQGNFKLSANALIYNPGQGVYRSAYMNTLRLARNEINLSYRESDYQRWQKLDFIVGYRIKNSTRLATVCPICKNFNGVVFPKSIKFLGFHVQCMCTAIPIQCTEEEFQKILKGNKIDPVQPDIPKEYTDYIESNKTKTA